MAKQSFNLHVSLMGMLAFLGCGTPSTLVQEPSPTSLSFESLAFYNSLVHGPKPELDQPEAVGGTASAMETGSAKSR